MSDISLQFSAFEYITITLILCGPGALVGLVIGAIGWREHRILGALFGALEGFALLLVYFYVYIQSPLSRSDSAAAATLKALVIASPGVAIGGAVAAWLWRGHRVLGGLTGAVAGFTLWLYGWWLLQ